MWKGIIMAVAGVAFGLALALSRQKTPEPAPVADVASALEAAGNNRAELEKVLEHFTARGDTLMLDAARYLIANMPGHSYVTYALVDSAGDTVAWDAASFSNYDTLVATFDSLEKNHPGLDFRSLVAAEDVQTISGDYLIEDIELAFTVWRSRPWARALPYESFREGILPYRGSNEPLEPWRRELMERYADLPARMKDSTDPIEAAILINNDIMKWFTFDERWYFHPTDQGLSEMKQTGLGRCEDMTNLTIYAFRANGLGVTSDYTPYWANSGNNHAWNAIMLPDGRSIPFMGAEANPGSYDLPRKAAKVYRKSFAQQRLNLAFVRDSSTAVPRWLGGKSYLDVTASYGPVSDVVVTLDSLPPDSLPFAYLCVFNDGEWKPIQWGRREGDKVMFDDMARNVVYLPGLYVNEKIVPIGPAFLLQEDGTRRQLVVDMSQPVDITCAAVMSRAMDQSSETVAGSRLRIGGAYEMFFWRGEWVSIGEATASDDPLIFLAPAGGLYRLVGADSNGDERIFTWDNGEQVWW